MLPHLGYYFFQCILKKYVKQYDVFFNSSMQHM